MVAGACEMVGCGKENFCVVRFDLAEKICPTAMALWLLQSETEDLLYDAYEGGLLALMVCVQVGFMCELGWDYFGVWRKKELE